MCKRLTCCCCCSMSKELLALSMPKDFMDRTTASRGELRISGGVCSEKVSLKCADEYSLHKHTHLLSVSHVMQLY